MPVSALISEGSRLDAVARRHGDPRPLQHDADGAVLLLRQLDRARHARLVPRALQDVRQAQRLEYGGRPLRAHRLELDAERLERLPLLPEDVDHVERRAPARREDDGLERGRALAALVLPGDVEGPGRAGVPGREELVRGEHLDGRLQRGHGPAQSPGPDEPSEKTSLGLPASAGRAAPRGHERGDVRGREDRAPLPHGRADLERGGPEAGPRAPRCGEDMVDVTRLLAILHERGVRRLLVEGGSTVNWSFFSAGLVDELLVYVGSVVIGGHSTPTLVGGEGVKRLEDATRLTLRRAAPLGGGMLLAYAVGR